MWSSTEMYERRLTGCVTPCLITLKRNSTRLPLDSAYLMHSEGEGAALQQQGQLGAVAARRLRRRRFGAAGTRREHFSSCPARLPRGRPPRRFTYIRYRSVRSSRTAALCVAGGWAVTARASPPPLAAPVPVRALPQRGVAQAITLRLSISTPQCSSVPRPVAHRKPVAGHSSITIASYSSLSAVGDDDLVLVALRLLLPQVASSEPTSGECS